MELIGCDDQSLAQLDASLEGSDGARLESESGDAEANFTKKKRKKWFAVLCECPLKGNGSLSRPRT
ncbi:hypothetical protein EYF80_026230 [Liparis tanakae]|uniref:Uncharacterized protein n=1 Tax=Liparis tanakae TaxID=230148 RepID=A0A4Z2HCI6_9TELE|nr:hypothetical protein EYF80_026230 [Liparis tanakae]